MKKTVTLLVFVSLALLATSARAAVTAGLTPGGFITPTIEKFQGPSTSVASYNFGNGMTFLNLTGQSDVVNYTGPYGMGSEPSVDFGGKDGASDGFFGTGPTPTTFHFAFAGGVTQFGFFGAESSVADGSLERNGQLDLEFFDLANVSIGTSTFSTLGTFAWNQFHGFSSDVAIGKVVFQNVGHMVVDDVYFGQAAVPEPATATLALLGMGVLALNRRKARV